jgi:hypothetical protein
MAACAWNSNFPRYRVGLGAMAFVASDLLIFARAGALAEAGWVSLAIWVLYYGGVLMIATGCGDDAGQARAFRRGVDPKTAELHQKSPRSRGWPLAVFDSCVILNHAEAQRSQRRGNALRAAVHRVGGPSIDLYSIGPSSSSFSSSKPADSSESRSECPYPGPGLPVAGGQGLLEEQIPQLPAFRPSSIIAE